MCGKEEGGQRGRGRGARTRTDTVILSSPFPALLDDTGAFWVFGARVVGEFGSHRQGF